MNVTELVELGSQSQAIRTIIRLQVVTLAWMLAECGISLYAAWVAHSPALLAFGSDSVVELLSATVVLLQFVPGVSLPEHKASRAAAILLFVLTAAVAITAAASLILGLRPDASRIGIAITVAALIAMPILAALKRREARRIHNAALGSDAVQSATCAYLAFVTLIGLAVNLAFRLPWIDSVAALVAVPFLVKEGRSAWQGHICDCC